MAAAAQFNTNIEAPRANVTNTYDLDVVITKYGFGEVQNFKYSLAAKAKGVSVVNNILSVSSAAFGVFTVEVSTNASKATASTKVYGFYATRSEMINSDTYRQIYETIVRDAKSAWPTLVGG